MKMSHQKFRLIVFYLFVCLKAIQSRTLLDQKSSVVVSIGDNHTTYNCSDCVHGHCVRGGKCDCLPNFGGENCDKICSFGRFGQHCEHDCSGYFDDANRKSWWKCKIDVLNVIEDCEDIWECWDKLYSCPEGSIGKNCEVPCPIGTFGALCLRKCNCNEKNTLECDKGTGQCMCKERFYGTHCENECIGKLTCGYGNYCTCEKLEHVLDEIERKFAENEERFEKSKKKSDSQLWKKILRRLDKEFEDQKREDEANRFLDSRIILLTVVIAFNGLASFIAFIVYRFKYKKLRQSQVVHVSAQHMRK